MNIYQVQIDGQTELYAATTMHGAIDMAEMAYIATIDKPYERQFFRDEVLQSCVLIGELESWPQGVTYDALRMALRCIAECHTQDDSGVGFTVAGGLHLGFFSGPVYIDSWKTVRQFLGLPVDPGATQ